MGTDHLREAVMWMGSVLDFIDAKPWRFVVAVTAYAVLCASMLMMAAIQ
jgi:hypothetical protein